MADMLLDPRSFGLLNIGLSMMQGAGPSKTPQSFGSLLGGAGQAGLQGYSQATELQRRQQAQQLQESLFGLKALEFQRENEDRDRQRQAVSQLTTQFPHLAPLFALDPQLGAKRAFPESRNRVIAAPPGAQLFKEGDEQPFATVPFKPEPEKPPSTRTVQRGDQRVAEEFRNGQWVEVGSGPAFARSVPPVVLPRAAAQKPPAGFRYKEDGETLEPIPGGPRDTAAKDALRAEGVRSRAQLVMDKVDQALNQVGFLSTGIPGAVLGKIPGTNAYDLDRTIDTIKANIGFNELQAMREASPTGGALGQVAIQELNMLQAVLSSLDKGQSKEQLVQGLNDVKKHYNNWKSTVGQASADQEQTHPKAPSPTSSPSPAAPQPPSSAIRFLKMNKANAAIRADFEAKYGVRADDYLK